MNGHNIYPYPFFLTKYTRFQVEHCNTVRILEIADQRNWIKRINIFRFHCQIK